MNAWSLLLGLLVFTSAVCVDYAHTWYVVEVERRRRWHAAAWSVTLWLASCVGFVVAAKVSLWYLPLEALGLFVGTLFALRPPRSNLPTARVL